MVTRAKMCTGNWLQGSERTHVMTFAVLSFVQVGWTNSHMHVEAFMISKFPKLRCQIFEKETGMNYSEIFSADRFAITESLQSNLGFQMLPWKVPYSNNPSEKNYRGSWVAKVSWQLYKRQCFHSWGKVGRQGAIGRCLRAYASTLLKPKNPLPLKISEGSFNDPNRVETQLFAWRCEHLSGVRGDDALSRWLTLQELKPFDKPETPNLEWFSSLAPQKVLSGNRLGKIPAITQNMVHHWNISTTQYFAVPHVRINRSANRKMFADIGYC